MSKTTIDARRQKKWEERPILLLSTLPLSQGIPSKFLDCLAHDTPTPPPHTESKGLAKHMHC